MRGSPIAGRGGGSAAQTQKTHSEPRRAGSRDMRRARQGETRQDKKRVAEAVPEAVTVAVGRSRWCVKQKVA